MKLRLLSPILFLSALLSGRAEIILNPGDVWEYSITNLNPLGGLYAPGSPFGHLNLNFNSFPSGTLQWEAYDNVGILLDSGTVNGTGQTGQQMEEYFNTWSTSWHDTLSGKVRLTMLSGHCALGSVYIVSTVLDNPSTMRWQGFTATLTETSPPPRLVAQSLTNAVALSWWTNGTTGYVLETANTLTANQWNIVPTAPVISSNRYVVNVGTNASAAYFRLRK